MLSPSKSAMRRLTPWASSATSSSPCSSGRRPPRGWLSAGPRQRVRHKWPARPAYRAAASRCIKIAGIPEVYTKALAAFFCHAR